MGTVAGKHIIGFCCVNDLMIESAKWSLYASILVGVVIQPSKTTLRIEPFKF